MTTEKPSTALAAIGLGLLTACGGLLLAYAAGVMPPGWASLGVFLGLFGAGFGLVPWWEWAFPSSPAKVVADEPEPATEVPAASYETVKISGIRPGVYHHYRPASATEAAWIDSIASFCLWARQLQSLASSKHVGVSVQNPNDWQVIIAPLVEHGAVLPTQKGVETRWAPEWDASRAYDAVRAGWVVMPETRAPHVAPFSAARQTVDAQVAG